MPTQVLHHGKTKKRIFVKIIFMIGVISFAYVFIHIQLYQHVVNKGSALAEERCLVVDPVVQEKQRKAYEFFTDDSIFTDEKKIQQMSDSLIPYFQKTVDVTGPWLTKQKAFLMSWDFNFFTHKALKDVGLAQYDKYEADYISNFLMIQYLKNPSDANVRELTEEIAKQHKRADILEEKIKIAENRQEFIYRFIHVPQSKCPEGDQFYNQPASPDSVAMLTPR